MMKGTINRIIAYLLIGIITFGTLPTALADEAKTIELDNGYIKLVVSTENGGFEVLTENGDRLNKDDNNKKLLFHSGDYDTSFTSFDVTYPDNSTKQYLFGGNYSFLGLGGNDLTVTKDTTGITSVWSVDGLTFTQRMELANEGLAEHGMVYIAYSVKNNKAGNVKVKARLLLDSSLGNQDYAYYEVVNTDNTYRQIETETVISTGNYIPANFYAYDNPEKPTITAYTVNKPESMPYQVAFGHWNNLASTLFDFSPDPNMAFINKYNLAYRTADSAYALYYDMGTAVQGGEEKKISTHYGVYSNKETAASDSVTINLTSPNTLELSNDKKHYISTYSGLEDGTFTISSNIKNYVKETAKAYKTAAVAIYTSNGITPLDSFGKDLGYSVGYSNPYNIKYYDFKVNDLLTTNFYFRADVGDAATYRKVEIKVFDMPDSANGKFLKENQLGSSTVNILCPGGDGNLPSITFTKAAPSLMYYKGTRHLTVTGNNFNMLEDKTRYKLYLKNNEKEYLIPSEQILFPEEGVLDILLTEEMLPGDYRLAFEWADPVPYGIDKHLTAPALHVVVSDDKSQCNDYYGIVAVVQDKGSMNYSIKTYKDEGSFNADQKNYGEVLLTFRGQFTPETKDENGNATKLSAFSEKPADTVENANTNNQITLNNCIDFLNGNISVYYSGSGNSRSVCVDFDGDLYTSNSRTSIWKGYAALTEIKNGKDYGLVPYNSHGERLEDFTQEQITLVWPCALGLAQTLSGMIFNLTYGALGIVYNDGGISKVSEITANTLVRGRVISFTAKLDLSFLVPNASKSEGEKEWDKMIDEFNTEDMNGIKLRDKWNGLDFTSNYLGDGKKNDYDDTKGQASVMINDILFGCGDGYIGFNCAVDVGLPSYVEAMPTIQGQLSINTIGGWALGVKGSCKFTTIEFEAEIKLKSYNNIPVPDKLYLFVTGFEPGINIDGNGVLWITSGGGGFENLYDTIFCTDTIPPLKLLISVTFDLFKVLSARADLGIGLRGISMEMSDVKIKATPIKALDSAKLQFDWYPELYFLASVKVNVLEMIKGSGYIIVVNNDNFKNFVEFYMRASVSIPKEVFLIGGMTIAQADLGANAEKIWGAVQALKFKFGVTYYWGKSSFDYGSEVSSDPTFPSLLGVEDAPVYYDTETGETLYMHVGTNISDATKAEIVTDLNSVMSLLDADEPYVRSDINKTTHVINTGNNNDAINITFSADTEEEARLFANGISIIDSATGNSYALTVYNGEDNIDTANANVTYNADTKKGSLAFTTSDSMILNVTTPVLSDIILYEIADVPAIDTVSGTIGGDSVTVNWSGIGLDKLDNVSFYLTKDDGKGDTVSDAGYCFGSVKERSDITAGTKSFQIPADLLSGSYYIRAAYSNENVVSGSITIPLTSSLAAANCI